MFTINKTLVRMILLRKFISIFVKIKFKDKNN